MNQQSIVPPPPIEFGSFRRLTPISRLWGSDRGQPIDRRYIETSLNATPVTYAVACWNFTAILIQGC
jgi:hypothetical protein